MSANSAQTSRKAQKFKLGPLGNLNQVTKGLAKTIRETASLERIEDRLDQLEGDAPELWQHATRSTGCHSALTRSRPVDGAG